MRSASFSKQVLVNGNWPHRPQLNARFQSTLLGHPYIDATAAKDSQAEYATNHVEMKRVLLLAAIGGIGASAIMRPKVEARSVNVSDTNKEVIQHLIERVWRRGHIDELPNFWTVDCTNHADSAEDTKGLHALRLYHEGFAKWFLDFDDIQIDVQQQVAENERVATQVLLRAVHREKHRNIALATIRIDRLEGEKIAEHWSVADTAGLMNQLA